MKKSIILMGIAALAFASCAKDTVKEVNNGRAIDFRVAAQTRATETTTANLSTFYVTAIDDEGANFFTDVAFTKIEEYFSSSPAYYWPGDGSELAFYAYAPSATNLGAEVTISNATKTLAGFSPAAEITNQKDFVTATAIGSKANETSGVALTFNHQLTQVEVKARNANEGYIYKVRGVRIAQPVAKADFDFGTSQWTLAADKAVYQVQYSNEVTLSTFAQCIMETEDDNAMLIPQQLVAWDPEGDKENTNLGAYLSVYAQVETAEGARVYPKADGMDYAWLAVPVDTKWEAGYKYVYTLDFTNGAGYPDPIDGPQDIDGPVLGDPIKFTMEVTPWGEKATMEATKNMLIGIWTTKRIERTDVYKDGSIKEYVYETEEEVRDNMKEDYWKIEILSETEFVIIGDGGNPQTSSYEIVDNYIYIEGFPKEGYTFFVRYIDENMSTFVQIRELSDYTSTAVFYSVREE